MRTRTIIMFLVVYSLTFPLTALSDDPEVYVVATTYYSYNYYMVSLGDGTFSDQQNIGGPPRYRFCYGNGIGDFDNDGDFDFIQGVGFVYYPKNIYLWEKLGTGNDFADPLVVGKFNYGNYPSDIAVADFDKDGNLDFIITYYGSFHTELYLGNGDLTFMGPTTLKNTTPKWSYGTDTADFNNDGYADFVSAGWGSRNFVVNINIGNERATFETNYVPQEYFYRGVTAADFNGDNTVDLLASYINYIDFYEGNGEGNFTFTKRFSVPHETFPIDNYDFDGDGDQDFVAGRRQYVDVYLNDGEANFTLAQTCIKGIRAYRYSISAPPYLQAIDSDLDGTPDNEDNCPAMPNPNQADSDIDGFGDACDECLDIPAGDNPDPDHPGCPANQPPVAQCEDRIVYADDQCLACANIDNGSYDPDGYLLTRVQEPECDYGLGRTSVVLTVTDDSGASDSCIGTVTVLDDLPPVMNFNPPKTITPPDVPISFQATAIDNCGAATAVITGYDCYKLTKKGKRIDKTESCVVSIRGDTITILESGGVGTVITWTVRATDNSRNVTRATFDVEVVNPGKGKGKK